MKKFAILILLGLGIAGTIAVGFSSVPAQAGGQNCKMRSTC